MAIRLNRLQVLFLWGGLCFWLVPMGTDAGERAQKEGKLVTGTQSFDLSVDEREQLEKRAEAGDAAAALQLAEYYSLAMHDVDRQVVWLRQAAELGNAFAQYNLASMLVNDTKHRNPSEARAWLEKAKTSAYAEGNDDLLSRIALRRNIEALEMTLEGAPITGAQFFNLTLKEREQLERRAAGEDAAAAMRVSQYYGLSLESDVEREAMWLRKAAELGSPLAQYNLAFSLIHDVDDRNLSEARDWLIRVRKSAEAEGDSERLKQIQGLEEDLAKLEQDPPQQ